MRAVLHASTAIAVLVHCLAAAGDPGSALNALVKEKTGERVRIHFEIRSRMEFRNELEYGSGGPQHGDVIRTRAGIAVQAASWFRLTFVGQDSRAPFLGRSAPGTMRDPFDVQEAYAELFGNSKRGFTADSGRRVLQYGDTRLIGAPQWAYTARTYDFARAGWRTGKHRFEALFISPIKPSGTSFNRPPVPLSVAKQTCSPRGNAVP